MRCCGQPGCAGAVVTMVEEKPDILPLSPPEPQALPDDVRGETNGVSSFSGLASDARITRETGFDQVRRPTLTVVSSEGVGRAFTPSSIKRLDAELMPFL